MTEKTAAKALSICNTGRQQVAVSAPTEIVWQEVQGDLAHDFLLREVVLPDSAAGPGGKPYGLPLRADLNAIRRRGVAGG
ncbi:hypothetical protein D3C78_1630000 [compost metagenome]